MPQPIEYVRVTDDVVPARAYSLPKRAFTPAIHTLLEGEPAVDVYGRPLPQKPLASKPAPVPAADQVPAPVEPNPKSGQKADPKKES